jgi:hypothetical protein
MQVIGRMSKYNNAIYLLHVVSVSDSAIIKAYRRYFDFQAIKAAISLDHPKIVQDLSNPVPHAKSRYKSCHARRSGLL